MWFLLMILLTEVPGISRVTVLHTYATAQECLVERNRIGYEMAEAYPTDQDYTIACQYTMKWQRPVQPIGSR